MKRPSAIIALLAVATLAAAFDRVVVIEEAYWEG